MLLITPNVTEPKNSKTNEITTAPKVMRALDLRSVVVTGDPMQAQRKLSMQIVEAHGDYVWTAKDNQPEMREEIALLFAPQQSRPGWSAAPTDFRKATTITKGHGRLEKRAITVGSLLAGYRTFPYVAQVFQVETWVQLTGDHSQHEVRSGLTGLHAAVASPQRLLGLVHGQWGIENGLHYRRDMTMREDHSQLHMGHAPHLLAILNNTVAGLVARQGRVNLAEARREFAYQFSCCLRGDASIEKRLCNSPGLRATNTLQSISTLVYYNSLIDYLIVFCELSFFI